MRCLTRGMLRGAIDRSRRPRPSSSGGKARLAGHLAADADRDARGAAPPRRRTGSGAAPPDAAGCRDGRPARRRGRSPACTGSDRWCRSRRNRPRRRARRRRAPRPAPRSSRPAAAAASGSRTPRRRSRRATWSSASRTWRISPTSRSSAAGCAAARRRRRAASPPSCGSSSRRSLQRQADRPQAERRVGAGSPSMAGQRRGELVAADVEGAHGDRPARPCRAPAPRRPAYCSSSLGQVVAVHVEELGAHEAEPHARRWPAPARARSAVRDCPRARSRPRRGSPRAAGAGAPS